MIRATLIAACLWLALTSPGLGGEVALEVTFGDNPQAAGGFLQIAESLYANGRLSPRLRELAYLRASQVNSCHY